MGYIINEYNRGLVVNGRRMWMPTSISAEFGISRLQTIDISIFDTSVYVSAPLTGFTDYSRMVAFLSYDLYNITNTAVVPNGFSQLDACVNSISEVILQRGLTGSGFHMNANVNVIQFSPATTVYKGLWSLGTTDLSVNIPLGATIDRNKSFVFTHIQSSNSGPVVEDGYPGDRAISSRFLDSSTINFERKVTDSAAVQGHWFVVTHPDISVFHGTITGRDQTTTSPIGYIIDRDHTFLLASANTAEIPYNQEGMWRLYVDGGNQNIVSEATYSGENSNNNIYYQLIQHPNLFVQQQVIEAVDSSNVTAITPIDLSRSIAISTVRSGYSLQPRYEPTYFNHMFFRFALNSSTYSNAYVNLFEGFGATGGFQRTAYNVIQFPMI